MIIVVTGGRDYRDEKKVFETLNKLHATKTVTLVVEGGASGADDLARAWALANGISVKTYPAQWNEYGKLAGPIRNGQMLDEERPDLVVAFPGGRGTANCTKQARERGLKVMHVL
jgi:hypothetical protein